MLATTNSLAAHNLSRQFITVCFISALCFGAFMSFSLIIGWPCCKDGTSEGYRRRTIYSEMEAAEVSRPNRLPLSPVLFASPGEGDLVLSVATAIDNDISDEEPRLLKPSSMNNSFIEAQNPIDHFTRSRHETHSVTSVIEESKTTDSAEMPILGGKKWKNIGKFKRHSRRVSVQKLELSHKRSRMGMREQEKASGFFLVSGDEAEARLSFHSSKSKLNTSLDNQNSSSAARSHVSVQGFATPSSADSLLVASNHSEIAQTRAAKECVLGGVKNDGSRLPIRPSMAFISLLDDARNARMPIKDEGRKGTTPVTAKAEISTQNSARVEPDSCTAQEMKKHNDVHFQAGRYKNKLKILRRPGNTPLLPPPYPYPRTLVEPPFLDSGSAKHDFTAALPCESQGSTSLERKALRRVERKSLINRPIVEFDPHCSPISATLLLPKPPGSLSSQIDNTSA